MITTGNLQKQSKAELAAMAKRLGINPTGKTKEQLIVAISRGAKSATQSGSKKSAKSTSAHNPKVTSKPATAAAKTTGASKSKASKSASSTKSSPSLKPKSSTANPPKAAKSAAGKLVHTAGNSKPTVGKATGKTDGSASKPAAASPAKKKAAPTTADKATAQSTKSTSTSNPRKDKVTNAKTAVAKPVAAKPAVAKPAAVKPVEKPKPEPKSNTSPKVLKKIREMQLQREATKDIGFRPRLIKPPGESDPIFDTEPTKDRIALFVRDPFWLHVAWDITRGAVDRAQAALAEQWYGAKPVLRLIRIDDSGATSVAETIQTEIEIRGGVRNWYIPWTGESASFRVNVGYLGVHGRFHVIAQSNIIKTPSSAAPDSVDQNWSDLGAEGEKIFALSGGYDAELDTRELQEMLEQRLGRSLGAPTLAKLGAAADAMYHRRSGFHFDMDVELVVYGSTSADAYLTVNEEPVALRPDGTFVLRLPFPDRRQVIPAVAVARDGSHQRTIVVGVERNTKVMEPMEQEQDLGD